jgi:hypothetical protein
MKQKNIRQMFAVSIAPVKIAPAENMGTSAGIA